MFLFDTLLLHIILDDKVLQFVFDKTIVKQFSGFYYYVFALELSSVMWSEGYCNQDLASIWYSILALNMINFQVNWCDVLLKMFIK